MSRTQTVTFNVGGEKFQVARSLLDFYPDSVLAKSISERWKQPDQDAKEEIFFDRCPQLFRQVLEYLRNKKVHLPITVSKNAVLSELEYYCVDDVEEEAIDESLTRRDQCLKRGKNDVDESNKESNQFKLAADSSEGGRYMFTEFRGEIGFYKGDIVRNPKSTNIWQEWVSK
jgi:hypothetical protein